MVWVPCCGRCGVTSTLVFRPHLLRHQAGLDGPEDLHEARRCLPAAHQPAGAVVQCVASCCVVLCCVVLCCVVLCCVVLCCVVLCCVVLCCVVLCCVVLCCVVLCCVMFYCVMFYCVMVCCVFSGCVSVLCCAVTTGKSDCRNAPALVSGCPARMVYVDAVRLCVTIAGIPTDRLLGSCAGHNCSSYRKVCHDLGLQMCPSAVYDAVAGDDRFTIPVHNLTGARGRFGITSDRHPEDPTQWLLHGHGFAADDNCCWDESRYFRCCTALLSMGLPFTYPKHIVRGSVRLQEGLYT